MERTHKSLLIARPPEKPLKTYQRPNKAALSKDKQADRPSVIVLDNDKSTESEENGQEHTHDLSVHSVPPEMLVINIQEVMSSTFFDPELLSAVKDRSLSTTFKSKPRTTENSAKLDASEFPEDPLKLDDVPTPAESVSVDTGIGQKTEKSEEISIEYEKTEVVRRQPNIPEGVILKTPAKPVVIKKLIAKPGTGSVMPTISEVVSLKTPAKPVVVKKIVLKSEAGSTSPTISEVVSLGTPAKPVVIQKILSKPEIGSTSPMISEVVSLETPAKPVVIQKIVVKSEARSASPTISDGVIPKVGARPVVIRKASEQPEAESAMPTASEAASFEPLSKPVMIQKVILKSDAVQASPATPGTPSVAQRILVSPEVSAVRIVKPTANLKVLEGGNNEVPVATVKRVAKSESPQKAKTSEGVLAKIKKGEGAKKSKLLKPSVVKAKAGAKKPDILKVAIVKKGPQGTKPKITVVKSEAVARNMVGLDKRSRKFLKLNADASDTKSPGDSAPENSSRHENIFEDDESDDELIHFPFLQPIPLPAIDDEPTGPIDAINELKEHLTPLLPRRWELRAQDTAICAFLFAPGPRCVAQRVVCAPYDGSRIKLIIHAREIPYDHSAYQFRLMRPAVPLTKDTVEEFAKGIMGAVHSLVQQNVCTGIDEKQFVEEWWKYRECRLDENLFNEEGYTMSLRTVQCSYLSRRISSKKCPECSAYLTRIRSREKRRADRQVGAGLVKKAKHILKKSPKTTKC